MKLTRRSMVTAMAAPVALAAQAPKGPVIDAHNHLNYRTRPNWADEDRKLIEAADKLGIEQLCCSILPPERPTTRKGFQNCNLWLSEAMKRFPNRVLGYCFVNPGYGQVAIDEVRRYVKRGFRSVKVKVGSPEIQRDIERLTKVREAVGPHIRIMMDANQGCILPAALELARAAQPLQITWFEEPLARTDYDGYAQLRRQAGMSIATGEREFDTVTLRELIRRDAIDLWQPDLLRLGSVEAWRASAALAHAHHIPVLPHYYKEYDVPLLLTVPNAYGAESFDWVDGLITNPIRMKDGFAYPNDGDGWGFSFKDEHLSELGSFD